mmetsp:Transcript_8057/g.20131  ORF Transcript_8057/g.20131 Transcript_8057/m.20131 type:complete len:145 (-) Transcript_8057:5386-5820(-)
MPLLMITYINNEYLGFFINMVTVMCFTGLHEVARELENPFQNVPNDIPLNNFQAQFNEGLMQMFTGYHPDAFWEVHPAESIPDPDTSYPPTKQRLESMQEKENVGADEPMAPQPAPATSTEEVPAPPSSEKSPSVDDKELKGDA